MHTDGSDFGYGGTLNLEDMEGGKDGPFHDQRIWKWRDLTVSITIRELNDTRKLVMSRIGTVLSTEGIKNLLLHVQNQAVDHIANSFVSSSLPMMWELRRLMDMNGLQFPVEWLPSVANRFVDALSRHFLRGNLLVCGNLRRSVLDRMNVLLGAYPYRPLGEHLVLLHVQVWSELQKKWSKE